MVSVEDAARLARELPEVVEGERHGHRTWFVSGKAFAWERPFSKADIRRFGDETPPAGPILAVRVEDLAEKAAVLAAQPKAFFTIPHFDGYAAVLIQLKAVTKRALREALVDGWLACASHDLASEFVARSRTRPRRQGHGAERTTVGRSVDDRGRPGNAGRVSRADVDAYLAAIKEPKRSTLEQVRRAILEVVPDAEECISYGAPAFKVQGKVVAGFAAFKNHLSYLPHSGSVFPALAADLAGYHRSSGALRFATDTPLPKSLIEKLITIRMEQLHIR